jgi:hypothetical protein
MSRLRCVWLSSAAEGVPSRSCAQKFVCESSRCIEIFDSMQPMMRNHQKQLCLLLDVKILLARRSRCEHCLALGFCSRGGALAAAQLPILRCDGLEMPESIFVHSGFLISLAGASPVRRIAQSRPCGIPWLVPCFASTSA